MSNLCDGVGGGPIQLRNSKAYCEGREAAAAGALIGTNPHVAGSEAAASWDAGHDSWTEDPAGAPARDCCANLFGGGYVAP